MLFRSGLFHRVAIARLPIEYNRPCSLYSDSTVRDKVLVSEKSLQRRYVSERLSHVYASNLCVFTDMSGTVLTSAPREGEDGFPMSVQRQLHRLIQNGAKLVVITGDALNMVVAHLITPLSGQLHRPFYVVTEAGASFYRVENGQVKELDLGLKKTFSQVEKNTLLKLFRDAFKKIGRAHV